jgi:heme-degrading monooxygenase HmoA
MASWVTLVKSADATELSRKPPSAASTGSFMAMSRFVVANGMEDIVRQAFIDRPQLVEQAQGFVRMSVLRPADSPAEFWLLTYWTNEQSYRTWHTSHAYHDSHDGIPKGLKLVPKSTQIRFFEQVTD